LSESIQHGGKPAMFFTKVLLQLALFVYTRFWHSLTYKNN